MYTRRLSGKCPNFNRENQQYRKSTTYQRPQKGKYLFETEDLNEANRPHGQEDHEQEEKGFLT